MDSHRKGPACRHDRPSRKFNSKFTIMCKLKGNPTEERVLMVRWNSSHGPLQAQTSKGQPWDSRTYQPTGVFISSVPFLCADGA